MWFYPKSKLGESWALNDLAERVQAADQLGYDVRLVVDGNGNLSVEYVERPGSLNV
jgi:L-alanine-DL-glutamate epimerase-like enolase superfamily enzyme